MTHDTHDTPFAPNGAHDAQRALAALLPGFADDVHDTQAVFRTLLDTLARPGTIGSVDGMLPAVKARGETTQQADLAAFAALLALTDHSTPVWLASDDAALSAALRFHTGAPLVASPYEAMFAYVHDAQTLPPLESFALGEAESPELAATVLIRVDALMGGTPVTLKGPGIEHSLSLAPRGLPERFWHERAALAPLFPCGIDCYFVCGDRIAGLPRTTHAEVN